MLQLWLPVDFVAFYRYDFPGPPFDSDGTGFLFYLGEVLPSSWPFTTLIYQALVVK
jgi:hypothetical protein